MSGSLDEWLVPQTPDGQNLTAHLVGERCVALLWSRRGAHSILVAPRGDAGSRILTEVGVGMAGRWCELTQGRYTWSVDAMWQAPWQGATGGYGCFRVTGLRRKRAAQCLFRWSFKHFEKPVCNRPAPADLLIGSPLRRGRQW